MTLKPSNWNTYHQHKSRKYQVRKDRNGWRARIVLGTQKTRSAPIEPEAGESFFAAAEKLAAETEATC